MNETQTISNLSSSRNVLRQVEINNAAMARLHSYYANYRTALVHQLDQKKPDLLDALKRTAKNACTTGGSFATAFGPTGGTPLNRGRNSLRDSQGAGNEVTMDSVDTIASKVVSANDRCGFCVRMFCNYRTYLS